MKICPLLPALCTVGALLTVATIWQPMYNRDVIGYIAAAYSWSGDDPQTVHERTYTDVERNTTDKVHAVLIGQTPTATADWYRRLAADPQALMQQLPFYQVRPAYLALLLVLGWSGLVTASLLLSKVAFLLIGLLVYRWLSCYAVAWVAALLTVLFMTLESILRVAYMASPDGLSALVVLAACYLFVEKRMLRTAMAMAALSILTNPDNLLLSVLLCACIMHQRLIPRMHVLLGLLAGLGIWFAVRHWSGAYGWPTLFYHNIIGLLAYPAEFKDYLSGHSLWLVYSSLAPSGRIFETLWWWLPIGSLALYARLRMAGHMDDWCWSLLGGLVLMLWTWLSLPLQEPDADRVPFYLLMLIGLATLISTHPRFGRGSRHRLGLQVV